LRNLVTHLLEARLGGLDRLATVEERDEQPPVALQQERSPHALRRVHRAVLHRLLVQLPQPLDVSTFEGRYPCEHDASSSLTGPCEASSAPGAESSGRSFWEPAEMGGLPALPTASASQASRRSAAGNGSGCGRRRRSKSRSCRSRPRLRRCRSSRR